MPPIRKKLEDAVETIWRQGLVLMPEALHYIDSTFACPSLEELEKILGDESSCEKDSLLELIFFPDQSIQVRLEDLLESGGFGSEDEAEISRALSAKRLRIALLLPAGRLTLAVPDWAPGRFIRRLNITKKLDPDLVDAIRLYALPVDQALYKVKLRNSRFSLTANKISFLIVFFKNMAVESRMGLDACDFLVSFFEELEDDADIYRALTQKKRFYFHNLQKAERYALQLKSSNMETLLLQGVRMPYFNMDEARRRMGLIDRICYAVFGRIDFFETGASMDLGEFDRDCGLEEAFKFLS